MKKLCFCILLIASMFVPNQHQNKVDAANLTVSVKNFGAVPNDGKLDTVAIQKAIDNAASQGGGVVEVPVGKYDVALNGQTALNMKSNVHLKLDKDTTIELKPNSLGIHRLILLGSNVSNVKISGGTLIGDRNGHVGTGGEWGHGIQFYGNAKNVQISDMTLKNFWGDGIEIGSPDANVPDGISINNITSDNNRRQGLSIITGRNIRVTNSVFKNTNGTLPAAGIDLERDKPYNLPLENVTIEHNILENNNGSGLAFVYVDSNTLTARYNIIRGNKEVGVYIGHSNKVTVAENIVSNNGSSIAKDPTFGSGVWLNYSADNKVLGNDISGSFRHGIHAVNLVDRNEFIGNRITANKMGAIEVWNGKKINISGNSISGNIKNTISLGNSTATQSNNGSNVAYTPPVETPGLVLDIIPMPEPIPDEDATFFGKLAEVLVKMKDLYGKDKDAAKEKLDRIMEIVME